MKLPVSKAEPQANAAIDWGSRFRSLLYRVATKIAISINVKEIQTSWFNPSGLTCPPIPIGERKHSEMAINPARAESPTTTCPGLSPIKPVTAVRFPGFPTACSKATGAHKPRLNPIVMNTTGGRGRWSARLFNPYTATRNAAPQTAHNGSTVTK